MAKVNYFELNEALKPINKNTVKAIERNSAKYIYVNRDRVAKCERCDHEFTLATTKHREMAKCPKCHRKFEVIHTWRKSKNESIHWEATATVITPTTFVIRYYLVERMDGKIVHSDECARLFANTDKKEVAEFEKSFWTGEWSKTGRNYFRKFHMCYQQNRLCCLSAHKTSAYYKGISQLPSLKYIDLHSIGNSFSASGICYIIPRANLYEKLQKVGLNALVLADLRTYIPNEEIKFDNTATEITKMLGINKNSLNLLKTSPTLNSLSLVQTMPNITEKEFSAFSKFDFGDLDTIKSCAKNIGCTPVKVANYIFSQGASVNEFSSYVGKLAKLEYNLRDHSYSMPKDMAKEMARLVEEEERKAKEFEAKKNDLIKAVHDELTSNKALKEFFNGSKGFMAYVPMSEEDFVAEGKAQHNCVGRMGYATKVASNQTLIFFVRELDNPSASFVTMEYRNGKIIQCMLDHNVRVKEDTKVYDFCSSLANRLNQCKILSA